MLTLENITASRLERVLFQDVSLSLPEGTCLRVRGHNGAGKTTLLKILAGLLPPAQGRLLWRDASVYGTAREGYFQDMVYIGHENALNTALTVEENLAFWAQLSGMPAVAAALAFFQLEAWADVPARQLSQGTKRRLEMARLIIKPASVWILDEPFAGLDADHTDRVLSLIASKCDQGGVVVFSHHGEVNVPFGQELILGDANA